jgi:hypothetical protein
MALNEKKRDLLAKILDHVRNAGEYPERERFRADIDTADWDALDQLVSSGFLFEEPYDSLLLPTFAGLGEMREHNEFAASEIRRALVIRAANAPTRGHHRPLGGVPDHRLR